MADATTQVEYEQTREDLLAYARFQLRASAGRGWLFRSTALLIGLFAVLVPTASLLIYDTPWHPIVIGIGGIALTGVVLIIMLSFKDAPRASVEQLLRTRSGAFLLGRRVLKLGARGLSVHSPHVFTVVTWAAINRLVRRSDYVFVYLDTVRAYVVPASAFADADTFVAFSTKVQELWEAAHAPPDRCPDCGHHFIEADVADCPKCGWGLAPLASEALIDTERQTMCSQCGYDISGHVGDTNCPECGTSVKAPVPNTHCPQCQELVPAAFDSCWNCGFLVAEARSHDGS